MPTFEVMTPENSAIIIVTNNLTGHSERVVTGRGSKFTAFAVLSFAKRHQIMVADVGYSVLIGKGT